MPLLQDKVFLLYTESITLSTVTHKNTKCLYDTQYSCYVLVWLLHQLVVCGQWYHSVKLCLWSHIYISLESHISLCVFRSLRALCALAMVLLSPAFTILYCVFIYQELTEAPVSLGEGWMLFLSVISQGILDHTLYGSLVYPLLALFIYPCWLMFWNILFWN